MCPGACPVCPESDYGLSKGVASLKANSRGCHRRNDWRLAIRPSGIMNVRRRSCGTLFPALLGIMYLKLEDTLRKGSRWSKRTPQSDSDRRTATQVLSCLFARSIGQQDLRSASGVNAWRGHSSLTTAVYTQLCPKGDIRGTSTARPLYP